MKILVTGANGYLGQGIVKAILELGVSVIASDLNCEYVDTRAKRIEGNLFEVDEPYTYFSEPDAVLHLAWKNGFVHNAENHIEDLYAHYDFLKKMADGGCKQIAVMGSMHEIGFFEGCIDENTPCNPANLYGIAKNALRDVIKLLCAQKGITYQWLRGYYIVGNSQFGSSIFSKITTAEKEGKEEFPFTTGKNKYDFLDYEDFCYQVACAVTQKEVDGIINICSGKPMALCERVEQFIKENNYKIKLKYGAFPDRPYDSKEVFGSSEKIEKIIRAREETR